MVGEGPSCNVNETNRRARRFPERFALARACVPSVLFHFGVGWMVLAGAPKTLPLVDARLDGTIEVLAIEDAGPLQPPADKPSAPQAEERDPTEDGALSSPERTKSAPSETGLAPSGHATRAITELRPPAAPDPGPAPSLKVRHFTPELPADAFSSALRASNTDLAMAPNATSWSAAPPPRRPEVPQVGAERETARKQSPAHVSPGVAASLRVYDTFPRMPEPLRASPTPHLIVMNVCVSTEGRVDDVRFLPGANPMLERTLRSAVNTWRYRPLVREEGPTAFCHQMGITYRTR